MLLHLLHLPVVAKVKKELLEELSKSIALIKATIKDLATQIEEKERIILSNMEGASTLFCMDELTFPTKMQIIYF